MSYHDQVELDGTPLADILAGKAAAAHTHAQSEVTDLVSDLAAKASSASLTSGLAGKANTSHTHAQSEITNLTSDLAGKAAASHAHAISDVTGLQTALDAKLAATALGLTSVVVQSADVTDSSAAFIDVTGLALPVKAGKLYRYEFHVIYSTDTATTGIGFGVSGPASPTTLTVQVDINGAAAAGFSQKFAGSVAAYNTLIMSANVAVINTKYMAYIRGIIRPSVDGTLQLRMRSEVASTVATVFADSIGLISQLA